MRIAWEGRELYCHISTKAGFDPVYGARPLKRFIQSKIETLVAKHIIAADVKPGDTLTIDVNENGELYMRW